MLAFPTQFWLVSTKSVGGSIINFFLLFYASVPREAINKQTKNTPAYASSEKETLRKMQSKDRRRYPPVLGHHTSLQTCKNDYFIFALADKINQVLALIVCHFRGPNSRNLFFLSRKRRHLFQFMNRHAISAVLTLKKQSHAWSLFRFLKTV